MGLSARPSAADLPSASTAGCACRTARRILLTGYEAESPRGRIHLIQALNEGRVEPNAAYRAAHRAVPGLPQLRKRLPQRRALRPHHGSRRARNCTSGPRCPSRERVFRRLAFTELLPHRCRLRALFGALLAYQRSGLQRLVRASGLLARTAALRPRACCPTSADAVRAADGRCIRPRDRCAIGSVCSPAASCRWSTGRCMRRPCACCATTAAKSTSRARRCAAAR